VVKLFALVGAFLGWWGMLIVAGLTTCLLLVIGLIGMITSKVAKSPRIEVSPFVLISVLAYLAWKG